MSSRKSRRSRSASLSLVPQCGCVPILFLPQERTHRNGVAITSRLPGRHVGRLARRRLPLALCLGEQPAEGGLPPPPGGLGWGCPSCPRFGLSSGPMSTRTARRPPRPHRGRPSPPVPARELIASRGFRPPFTRLSPSLWAYTMTRSPSPQDRASRDSRPPAVFAPRLPSYAEAP